MSNHANQSQGQSTMATPVNISSANNILNSLHELNVVKSTPSMVENVNTVMSNVMNTSLGNNSPSIESNISSTFSLANASTAGQMNHENLAPLNKSSSAIFPTFQNLGNDTIRRVNRFQPHNDLYNHTLSLKHENAQLTDQCNKLNHMLFQETQKFSLLHQRWMALNKLHAKLLGENELLRQTLKNLEEKFREFRTNEMKLVNDLKLAKEEHANVLYEYNMIMFERDNVNKETEKLQDELTSMTKRLDQELEEKIRTNEEIKKLKLTVSQVENEKEQLLKECYELRERHRDFSSVFPYGDNSPTPMSTPPNYSSRSSISRSLGKSSSSDLLGSGSNSKNALATTWHSSYGHFSPIQQQQSLQNNLYHLPSHTGHQVSASSSSSSVSTLSHLPLTKTSSNAKLTSVGKSFEAIDSAAHEIDFLRKQNNQLKKDLQECQMEAQIAKTKRDWALHENKKIVLERESIKNFCDSLRKERNQRDRELSKALTDNDELKRQLTEAIQVLSEHKEIDSETGANASNTSTSASSGNVINSPSTNSSSLSNSSPNDIANSGTNNSRHNNPDGCRSRDSAINTDTELHDFERELLKLNLTDRHQSESSELTHHESSSLAANSSSEVGRLDADTSDPPNSPVSVTEGETAPSSPMPPVTPSSCSIILQRPYMNHYSLRTQQVQSHQSSVPHHMTHHPPQLLPHHLSQQSSHLSSHATPTYTLNSTFDHRLHHTYHLPSASFSPSPSPSASTNSAHFFVPYS